LVGSASDRVPNGQWNRRHPSARKFGADAAIHGSLENFKSVDPAFSLTVAPTFGQRAPDRIDILPQCSHEALHCVENALLGVVEPRVVLSQFAVTAAERSGGASTTSRRSISATMAPYAPPLRQLQSSRPPLEQAASPFEPQPGASNAEGWRSHSRARQDASSTILRIFRRRCARKAERARRLAAFAGREGENAGHLIGKVLRSHSPLRHRLRRRRPAMKVRG
jgi:hypothetical protein